MTDSRNTKLRQLLVLLAVGAAATVVAVAGTGALGFSALDAVVAFAVAGGAVASLPYGRRWVLSPTPIVQTSSPAVARTKKILVLAMAAGAVAWVGGRGTFAVFTADTANPGSSMSSGTLVLNDKVGATSCWSYGGATNDNVNTGCSSLLSPSNMAPGAAGAQTSLTIQNGGSLDASTFTLMAPWPRATLATALTAGVAPTQLSLTSGLTVAMASGDQVTVSYAGRSQTFTVGAAGAAIGATVVPLTAAPPANYAYPVNSRIEDLSGDATASNTDCYDVATTNATVPVAGATPGNALPFVSTGGNPLCSAALLWVQEQTNGVNYCWVGRGSTGSPAPSARGMCRTPTTAALSGAGVTAGTPTTTLNVAALAGNIVAGDTLTITQGAHQDTITTNAAMGNAYINDTTVAINSWTPSFSYTSAAVIKDTTAFAALDGDTTDTISSFDTLRKPSSPVTLYPLTSNTTAPDSTATVSLGKTGSSGNAGYQRTFYIGVYLPATSSQNQLQGLISTFGLNWHIQQ
ncbi:MAG TPA: hypothetical protein VFL60_09890 [Gaiellaceae bacterium]|nr:hypothetical protein [Gaiellaceae bacterium]